MEKLKSSLVNNQPHSAEYFGDERNFWWNQDYLALVASRLDFKKNKNILDVGCGVGHWGQTLAPFLNDEAKVIGIDREQKWIDTANRIASGKGILDKFNYVQGDAMCLPFADETFDFVTCQTLLIHLKNPIEAIKEMQRVLKQKGLILISEPNNTANRAISNSLLNKLSVDERVKRIKNDLTVQKGKEALGEGFNSLGDLVPGYMQQIGFKNIKVTLGDKASLFIPPYKTEMEKAYIKTKKDWAEREFIGWHRDDLHRYFIAGGGSEQEYDEYVKLSLLDQKNELAAIEKGEFHSAGGSVNYLVSANKV